VLPCCYVPSPPSGLAAFRARRSRARSPRAARTRSKTTRRSFWRSTFLWDFLASIQIRPNGGAAPLNGCARISFGWFPPVQGCRSPRLDSLEPADTPMTVSSDRPVVLDDALEIVRKLHRAAREKAWSRSRRGGSIGRHRACCTPHPRRLMGRRPLCAGRRRRSGSAGTSGWSGTVRRKIPPGRDTHQHGLGAFRHQGHRGLAAGRRFPSRRKEGRCPGDFVRDGLRAQMRRPARQGRLAADLTALHWRPVDRSIQCHASVARRSHEGPRARGILLGQNRRAVWPRARERRGQAQSYGDGPKSPNGDARCAERRKTDLLR